VTSIEYALLAALIAMVCVVAVKTAGTNLSALFTDVCNKVSDAISGAPAC
jgi:Flp pilus assembly pilin Flp